MTKIKIEDRVYKIVENLGYQGGYYAKVVETPDGERIVVKHGGSWVWWKAEDRVQLPSRMVGM